jgi:hypothetical protein
MVVPEGIPNPELYRQLLHWREETARKNGVPAFEVATNGSLREIVIYLPISKAGLLNIPGIGKRRLQRYGQELLAIVQKYRDENQIEDMPTRSTAIPTKDGTQPLPHSLDIYSGPSRTKQISFDMFRSGMSISEIAVERKRADGTIAGHLAHFVETGDISIFSLLDFQKVEEIRQYFLANPSSTASEAKTHFGEKYDYGKIKMVVGHLNFQKSKLV